MYHTKFYMLQTLTTQRYDDRSQKI
jgi:hypothetical protein